MIRAARVIFLNAMYWEKQKKHVLLRQGSRLLPGHGARVEHNICNNVNTPFLQVPTRELRQDMGATVQGRDKKWVPEYTMYPFTFRSEAIYGFAYP